MKFVYLLFCLCSSLKLLSAESNPPRVIDLRGDWRFSIDSLDQGRTEEWYRQTLRGTIKLPGSMAENGLGNDVSLTTQWTGQIVDSSWFYSEKYAKYRQPGNIKIPFWLQPTKHYVGTAWYQRDVEIPDNWEGKHVSLTLERVHWESEVWVNGQYAGMRNSLGTAQVYDLTKFLKPGKNILSIKVDNSIKEVNPGSNSHSITDHTQSNWNGVVGDIALRAKEPVLIADAQLYPDVQGKTVKVEVVIKNYTGTPQQGTLSLRAQLNGERAPTLQEQTQSVEVDQETTVEMIYPMGDNPALWDEFTPNLYEMSVSLTSNEGTDTRQQTFGMREFTVDGRHFAINGRPVFLRGALECAIFPLTGYPPTDVDSWKRIVSICQDYGLNHLRFHSWCPPKAAFVAADELGFYLQVEASSWANFDAAIGEGKPIDEWLYQEADLMFEQYGNHPSFVMMAYGNEPTRTQDKAYLIPYVDYCKKTDPRHLYTSGAGWPYVDNMDFYDHAKPRIQQWQQGLESEINKNPPNTQFDYEEIIQAIEKPYVSHEMGEWCVYPNFQEIEKYTGVLRAKNFEIFQETLAENGMADLSEQFVMASGKLQALCYKADIEAGLRTKDFAGFQLLDLNDFSGQGTALVGVLDAFWDEKEYISAEKYRQFCGETVPLARFAKRMFYDNEPIVADVEVAHYGAAPLANQTPTWRLVDADQTTVAKGKLETVDIPLGNGFSLGRISVSVASEGTPQQLTLRVDVEGNTNTWDVWVYPAENEPTEEILMVDQLDQRAMDVLNAGGKVLLSLKKGSLKPEKGGDIAVGFSSIFWNTAWTEGQAPHTLGVLVDPNHAAFAEFPTEYHSNWQWWDAMSHSNAIMLRDLPPGLTPIVRVIDDWFTNRSLGLVFEARVGAGGLLVSGVDFWDNLEARPAGKQLLHSLKKYMSSSDFAPQEAIPADQIKALQ